MQRPTYLWKDNPFADSVFPPPVIDSRARLHHQHNNFSLFDPIPIVLIPK